MDDDVAREPHGAGLGIDLDLDHMGAVGIGERRRLEIDGGRKPRRDLPGSANPGTPLSACATSASVRFICGTPLTRTSPSTSSRSSAATSSMVGGRLARLVGDHAGGEMHGVAGGHRLAAGIGAMAERAGRGVAGGDLDVVRGDAEHAGGELRQHGSVPWPCAVAPVVTKIFPDGPMRTAALSNGPRPVPST